MQLVFDPKYRRLVDFLSLDSVELEEPHVPEKIMFLYDWAEKKTKGNLEQVLGKLNSLKKEVGSTLRGKPLLIDLYKWTRLDAQKMIAKEEQKIKAETDIERQEREEKMARLNEDRVRTWQETKDQLRREVEEKSEANIRKTNYLARMIKSEDRQQSRTNVNYKVAKDELPQAVRVKAYDIGE